MQIQDTATELNHMDAEIEELNTQKQEADREVEQAKQAFNARRWAGGWEVVWAGCACACAPLT